MLIPVSPVVPGLEDMEVVIYKDQPQYMQLPVLCSDKGQILTRWVLSQEQREAILNGADIFISVLTFGKALQPLMVDIGDIHEEGSGDILGKFGIAFVPNLDETKLMGE